MVIKNYIPKCMNNSLIIAIYTTVFYKCCYLKNITVLLIVGIFADELPV